MRERTERTLCFNGLDLDPDGGGGYLREPMPLGELHERLAPSGRVSATKGRDVTDGVVVERLDSAGWALVVPEGEEERFTSLLAPLLALRREQAGDRYREPIVYSGQDLGAFLADNGAGPGDVDPRDLPYYLVLAGSPDKIPFDFQCLLDADYAVGRIDFEHDEDYAIYVDHLIRHETEGSWRAKELSFFGPCNNDPLTHLSNNDLVTPLFVEACDKSREIGQWTVSAGPPTADTRARLEWLLSSQNHASLLFTAGHGVAVPRDPWFRRRWQGGIVCADWQAPDLGDRDHCFCAEDLSDQADLSGMMIFSFGCYSAGTPRYDRFVMPDGTPEILHELPFPAALAQKMLLRGALGVIGHVDQAFWHSFLWHDRIRSATHLENTLARLMRGYPVGHAMGPIHRRATTIAAWILDRLYDSEPPSREELDLFKWLAWQDATNYVLLGDPAARLFPNEAVLR